MRTYAPSWRTAIKSYIPSITLQPHWTTLKTYFSTLTPFHQTPYSPIRYRPRRLLTLLTILTSLLVIIITFFHFTTTSFPTIIDRPPVDRSCANTKNINDYYHHLQPQLVFGESSTWSQRFLDLKRGQMMEWVKEEILEYDEKRVTPAGRGSRGIVSTVSMGRLQSTLTLLGLLKRLGCILPVELFHFGDEMTLPGMRVVREFEGLNVTLRDVEDGNNIVPVRRKGKKRDGSEGYQIKIAAILSSSFEDVLFLDSDVLPVTDPTFLFDLWEFREKGAVFWPDLWKTHTTSKIWSLTQTPCRNEFEFETGQLLLSRSKTWPALHLTHYMNTIDSQFFYKLLWYDKDTFRFAFKTLKTPYHMMPRWVGFAGFVQPTGAGVFCGHSMAQADHVGKWVFMHGNSLKRVDLRTLREEIEKVGGKGRKRKEIFEWIQVVDVPIGREWMTPVSVKGFQSEGEFAPVGGYGAGEVKKRTMSCHAFFSGRGEPSTKLQDFEKVLPGFNEMLLEEYEGAAAVLEQMAGGKGIVEELE
ncbi:hypothetical protein HK097_008595 [Rhizophlyctis rosea]|uniref:Glycosyltransferase family 71 protein n=1 Tax=Rhizophlyctis rosea TaxID=64517 RepID=A0AAD5SA51_9FUNG|nr:hypothetical protein HK097_008595 [Rhizophlyctis rosea]